MSQLKANILRNLSQTIDDRKSLAFVARIIRSIEELAHEVDRGSNLGDLFHDAKSAGALEKLFGLDDVTVGWQLLQSLVLEDFETGSKTLYTSIDEDSFGAIYKAIKSRSVHSDVVCMLTPPIGGDVEESWIWNPLNSSQWPESAFESGSMLQFFVRTQGKSDRNPEAEDRLIQELGMIFDMAQKVADDPSASEMAVTEESPPEDEDAASVSDRGHKQEVEQDVEKEGEQEFRQEVELDESLSEVSEVPVAQKPRAKNSRPSAASRRQNARPRRRPRNSSATSIGGELTETLRLQVNKMDTFVHAGNAQLIVKHLVAFKGRVDFFVERGERQRVPLDADSIWGAEIRNGEFVVFEFYGDQPDGDFLRELAVRTNQYTQMDKMAG